MNLLLVDDHALFREGMELVLRHLDPRARVRHAANVKEALNAISDVPPVDLVLLDLHMPGMHGLDALNAIRERAEAIPVVVLSGSEDLKVVARAIDGSASSRARTAPASPRVQASNTAVTVASRRRSTSVFNARQLAKP